MSANPKLGENDPSSAIAANVARNVSLLKTFNEIVMVLTSN